MDPRPVLSLGEHGCSPYVLDEDHFENLLNANSERMLVPEGQSQIKLMELGNKGMLARWMRKDQD